MQLTKTGIWLAAAIAVAGCTGDDGRDGMDGEPGDQDVPSVTGVTPSQVFLDRQTTVSISGNATAWTDAATVDFGAGITVDDLIVASPTAIVADITIDETATVGRRDVVVTDADGTVTFAGAFAVDPPLSAESPIGTFAQGSIVIARLRQHDVSTPFDTTGAPDFPYLIADAGAGTSAFILDASPYTMDVQFLLDVNVAAGATDVRAFSDDADDGTTSLAPGAMTIAARPPTALVTGVNTGTVGAPLSTLLYSFTPAANQLVTINASSTTPGAEPAFALLGPSGSFADLISYDLTGSYVATTADPIYVVVWDATGASGYGFDLDVQAVTSDETEPNDTCTTAQTVGSLPANLANLSLTSGTDEDWFAVTIGAGDVGNSFHVATTPGDTNTDTYVEIFTGPCGSETSLGTSSDLDYHEDFSVPITAAGTYYVKISNSPDFPFAGSAYNLLIETVVPVDDEPANNTCAGASAASTGAAIGPLQLSSIMDEDWFRFTAAAGDVGSAVRVVTAPGDSNTDTVVEVFSGTCGGLTSLGGPSADTAFHENHLSTALTAAGDYWVKVSYSTFGFAGNDYQLTVTLE